MATFEQKDIDFATDVAKYAALHSVSIPDDMIELVEKIYLQTGIALFESVSDGTGKAKG
jgi:hypothetical protein